MDPHDHNPSLGLSIQDVAKLTPEEYKRYKFVQRSHEEAHKRRNEPNRPEPLDLRTVLAMNRRDFEFLQLERKSAQLHQRELKRQARNAKFEQQPPEDPNVLTPDELEKIRKQQKLNRLEAMAMRARSIPNDYI